MPNNLTENLLDKMLSMKIRVKLGLIMGLMIIIVVVALMSFVATNQQQVLIQKSDETCSLLVNNLASSAKDYLLLNSEPEVQQLVRDLGQSNVDGLKFVFITDRKNMTVAHSDFNMVKTPSPTQLLVGNPPTRILQATRADSATNAKQTFFYEQGDNYIYIDSIFVRKSAAKTDSTARPTQAFLGTAQIVVSKERILEPIRRQQLLILLTSGGVLILGLLLGFVLSKQIVSAIVVIADAAKKVAGGDYNLQINIRTRDELGNLAAEFNEMVKQLRKKHTMQKFLSEMTVEMIDEKDSEGAAAVLGGKREEVTLFFSDIRGFTSMSEKLEPEKVIEIVNVYLDLQTTVIRTYGGYVDKFLGDGIMAIFRGDRMADRAIAAALDVQSGILDLNQQRAEANTPNPAVGIGINVGTAVLGNIGSRDRMDYTAIGDVVNLASRLCSVAEGYGILVSESVIGKLEYKYAMKAMQTIKVKGKEKPVDVYAVDVQQLGWREALGQLNSRNTPSSENQN
jgi:class 3 adenylate cyclase